MENNNFLVNLNLNQNELVKATIENHANDTDAGTGVPGQVYYNTSNNLVMVWTTKWEPVGTSMNLDNEVPIQITTVAGISTISIDLVVPSVGAERAATSDGVKGAMYPVDKEKLDTVEWHAKDDQISVEVPHTSLASDVSDENGALEVETALNNIGSTLQTHRKKIIATSEHNELKKSERVPETTAINPNSVDDHIWASEKQIADLFKGIAGGGRPAEAYPTGGVNVPYPPTYDGGAILKGDQFIITDNGGSIGLAPPISVNSNDTLLAKKDAAGNVHADWYVIKAPPPVDASYSVKGVTKYSIDNTGVVGLVTGTPSSTTFIDDIIAHPDPDTVPGDHTSSITPLALQYFARSFPLLADKIVEFDGTAISGTVVHGWNNKNVMVSVYDKATGMELTGAITRTADSVKITFNKTPTAALSILQWVVQVAGEDRKL